MLDSGSDVTYCNLSTIERIDRLGEIRHLTNVGNRMQSRKQLNDRFIGIIPITMEIAGRSIESAPPRVCGGRMPSAGAHRE